MIKVIPRVISGSGERKVHFAPVNEFDMKVKTLCGLNLQDADRVYGLNIVDCARCCSQFDRQHEQLSFSQSQTPVLV